MPAPEFDPAAHRNAETLIELAFAEDLGTPMPCLAVNPAVRGITLEFAQHLGPAGDLTTEASIPSKARGAAGGS